MLRVAAVVILARLRCGTVYLAHRIGKRGVDTVACDRCTGKINGLSVERDQPRVIARTRIFIGGLIIAQRMLCRVSAQDCGPGEPGCQSAGGERQCSFSIHRLIRAAGQIIQMVLCCVN